MINVATAGGNIDYWGEYFQVDYDVYSVSQDEWGFVVVDVSAGDNPQFTVKRISRGNENLCQIIPFLCILVIKPILMGFINVPHRICEIITVVRDLPMGIAVFILVRICIPATPKPKGIRIDTIAKWIDGIRC